MTHSSFANGLSPASPGRVAEGSAGNAAALARKLRRLIDESAQFVPFYRELWRDAGVDPKGLRLPEDLQSLPVVSREDLRRVVLEDRLDARYRHGRRLAIESTSGSTGQPFDMHLNAGSLRRRRLRFLRALHACGYRPWHRLMLISSQSTATIKGRRSWMNRLGWNFSDVAEDSASLLRDYGVARPHVLYGPLSSLLVLGQDLAASPQISHRPAVLISTAEQLTASHRRLLRHYFGVDASDFYGMTELGLVAWCRPRDFAYRPAAGSFLFEFLPAESGEDLERLVITDLSGGAMPWIRFDTGDLVCRDHARAGAPLLEFSGREIDCLWLPGDRKLSPYRVSSALEEIPGLERFEVIQRADRSVDINVWSPLADVTPLLDQVTAAIRRVCDGQLPVRVHHRTAPLAVGAGKLRPVRSEAQASA
jgi:phenylacetate-CoA ligase